MITKAPRPRPHRGMVQEDWTAQRRRERAEARETGGWKVDVDDVLVLAIAATGDPDFKGRCEAALRRHRAGKDLASVFGQPPRTKPYHLATYPR